MIKYLLGRASTGKFRFWICESDEEWHDDVNGYVIKRSYGQVNGKTTLSPDIVVDKTKQKRTWVQQLELQFNSEVKKQLDKGYVEVSKHPNEYSESELQEIYGDVAMDQSGVIKPMLAKKQDDVTNRKIFDKAWLCSRKLDGVRCLMYWDGEQIRTASRGGENYDPATTHIRENKLLIELLKTNPTIILDGELYRHGKTLQQISGAARLEKNAYDSDWLEYWIYDCYDKANPDMTAWDRYDTLLYMFSSYSEGKDHYDIRVLRQTRVEGEENIWKLHDQYVQEGFEGCVIRDPSRPYKPKGRTNDMIKFKNYKSDDFKVVGYKLGLRGSEDMTFTCELPDGRTFEAMPVGDRATKAEYVENFESKYKGHMVECTYFNYSDEGKPTQPKARVFRFDLE